MGHIGGKQLVTDLQDLVAELRQAHWGQVAGLGNTHQLVLWQGWDRLAGVRWCHWGRLTLVMRQEQGLEGHTSGLWCEQALGARAVGLRQKHDMGGCAVGLRLQQVINKR